MDLQQVPVDPGLVHSDRCCPAVPEEAIGDGRSRPVQKCFDTHSAAADLVDTCQFVLVSEIVHDRREGAVDLLGLQVSESVVTRAHAGILVKRANRISKRVKFDH